MPIYEKLISNLESFLKPYTGDSIEREIIKSSTAGF